MGVADWQSAELHGAGKYPVGWLNYEAKELEEQIAINMKQNQRRSGKANH